MTPKVLDAAERVGARASGGDRGGYAKSRGFVEWLPMIALIAKSIMDIFQDCQEPDQIVSTTYQRPREARKIAYAAARARVAESYSWFGRIFYRGQIDRASSEIADAMLAEVATVDPSVIRELANEIKGS